MSIFDHMNPFSDTEGLDPALEALMDHASKLVTRHQVAERGMDWLSGDVEEEGKRLDNAMKRRALGYPDSSDEYEDSTNYGTPLTLAGLGGAMQRIPEPGFMKPNSQPHLKSGQLFDTKMADSLGKQKWAFLSNGLNAFGEADKVKPKSALKGIKNAFRFLRF